MAVPRERITALPQKSQMLIQLSELDKLALLEEEPVGIDRAAEILGVHRGKAVEYCKQLENPLPHDMLGGEYVLFPTLVRWWRVNRQKVQ